jgi:hypothetical protein
MVGNGWHEGAHIESKRQREAEREREIVFNPTDPTDGKDGFLNFQINSNYWLTESNVCLLRSFTKIVSDSDCSIFGGGGLWTRMLLTMIKVQIPTLLMEWNVMW